MLQHTLQHPLLSQLATHQATDYFNEPTTTWPLSLPMPCPMYSAALYKLLAIYHIMWIGAACECRIAARSCTASGGGFIPQPCCTPIYCISWYALRCLPAQAAPCTVFLSLAYRMCICLSLKQFPCATSLMRGQFSFCCPCKLVSALPFICPCLIAASPSLG